VHARALDDLVDGAARAVHGETGQVQVGPAHGAHGGPVVPVVAGREEIRGKDRQGHAPADACNRVEKAVGRTVPFGFLIQSLLVCWYARSAYSPADIDRRRRLCPWYRTKTSPSATDMLARLRREFLKARFSAIRPGRDGNDQIDMEAWTCGSTAA
jgi:hypothetical protein